MDALDALIADSVRRAKEKKRQKKQKKTGRLKPDDVFRKTKEELRQIALEKAQPVSLHMRITQQHCRCGRTFSSVNNVPLVKKKGSNFMHYEPPPPQDIPHMHTMELYQNLPRSVDIVIVDVPYCAACFPGSTVCTVTKDDRRENANVRT